MAEVKLDFEVLARLGEVAREHGLAGAVQHGASTLPDELFHRFPAVETAEIHLATGFQNALFEHPAFPAELHSEIEAWVFENALDERKPDQTDEQFVYTTRKKAIGPFKRQLWDLADEGRDPRRPAAQDRVPVHGARRERVAGRWSSATSSRSSSHPAAARRAPRRPRPRPGAELWPISGRRGCSIRPEMPADTAAIDRVQLARVRRSADPAADRRDPGLVQLRCRSWPSSPSRAAQLVGQIMVSGVAARDRRRGGPDPRPLAARASRPLTRTPGSAPR